MTRPGRTLIVLYYVMLNMWVHGLIAVISAYTVMLWPNAFDGWMVRQSGGSGRRPVQPDGVSGAGRPSLSCPRREGVLLAAGGGERIWHFTMK